MAEHGRGNARIVDLGWTVAEEGVGESLGFADRHGGQLDPVRDVADGERRRNRRAIVRVDLDLSFLAHVHADILETHAARVRLAPGREQHLVRLDVVAAGHGDVQHSVFALLNLLDRRVELEVDALAHRDLHQAVDELLVILAQDHVGPVDQGHMAAELVKDAGELVSDIAAADEDDPLGQRGKVKHLVRADSMLRTLDRRHDRGCAGGNEDLLGGHFLAACKADRVRSRQLCPLMENRHIVICERLGVRALDTADLGEHVVAEHRPAEPLLRNVPTAHRGVLEILGKVRAVDEQLLGYAAADHASAADLMLLGDRDPRAVSSRDTRGAHAARAGTNHKEVEVSHFTISRVALVTNSAPELQSRVGMVAMPAGQTPARSIKARVEASRSSWSVPSASVRAISLPSSTPNWSNGLMPYSTALANVRCS